MKQRKPSLKGYSMICGSAIAYASYGLWSKLINPEFAIFTQGWIRSAIMLLLLVPVALLMRQFRPVMRGDIRWLVLIVLCGALIQAPAYYAYIHTEIGTATVVFYAFLLIASYLVGYFALGEQIGWVKRLALLLAIVGMGVVFRISLAHFSFLALAMAGLSGAASGGEISFTKKLPHLSALQLIIYVNAGIVATHLPLALMLREPLAPIAATHAWLGMVGFTAAGIAAFWLVVQGFHYVDASIGALVGLTEIIVAVLFGIIFYHEELTLCVAFGGGIILLAAMLPDTLISFKRYWAQKQS